MVVLLNYCKKYWKGKEVGRRKEIVVGDGWIKYVVVGIEDDIYSMDGCGRTGCRGENLDDQNIIFLLENRNKVPWVRIA